MSFLSILLVSSAFYFVHARPDSQSWSDAYGGAQAQSDDGYVEHDELPAEPFPNLEEYQHKLVGFMKDVSEAADKYMTPLMSKLDVKKQDELKSMGMNGFASYVNYWLLLIQEKENEKDKVDQTYGDELPRDEMILQFESYYPENTPFIPAEPSRVEDEQYAE